MNISWPKIYMLGLIAFFLGYLPSASGQCPGTPDVTVTSQTAATCPSNGSAILGGNGVGISEVLYKIVAAPNSSYINNFQPGTQNTFSNLEPGTYTIEMSCVGSTQADSVTFTISNQYTPVSGTVAVSNVCQGGTPGGTITISNITGSSVPLQYAFYQTSDANIADNLLTYGTATTYTATALGDYIVRIKDQCGAMVTYPVNLAGPTVYALNATVTVEGNLVHCDTMELSQVFLVPPGGGLVNVAPTGGVTVNIYYASSLSPCTKGSLFSSRFYAEGTDLNATATPRVKVPTGQNFVVEIVNSCGQAGSLVCVTTQQTAPVIKINVENASCNTVAADTINLLHQYTNNMKTPITYCLYDGNTQVGCNTSPTASLFYGLPTAGHNYKVIATDVCGRADTISFTTPSGGAASTFGYAFADCGGLNKVGVVINVSGNIPKASQVIPKIVSGPCCVGQVAGSGTGVQSGTLRFNNLVPGDYKFVFDYAAAAGCSTYPDTFSVTVPPVPINFYINSTANQVCGGTASITSLFAFSHSAFIGTIRLKNLSGTVLDANSSGTFNNVATGTYIVEFSPYSTGCNTDFGGIAVYDTVEVLAANATPVAAKKFGFICEDGNGDLLSTGSALFEINGFGPYDVYYSTTNIQPSTPQLTAQNSPLTISGLTANQTYYFWFKDQCGNTSAATQLGIGALGSLSIAQTVHPCNGNPYSLSMLEYPGATYEWKKGSTVVANSREYVIPIYNSSYDGTYTGTMTVNGCLIRSRTISIADSLCNTVLPLQLIAFNANRAGSTALLRWNTAAARDVSHFDIERSSNGNSNSWSKIGSLKAALASAAAYQFSDLKPQQGYNYYRLKMVDIDGKYKYSPVRSLQFDGQQTSYYLFPNPARGLAMLVLPEAAVEGSQLKIFDLQGKEILRQSIDGMKVIDINMDAFASGTYILVVSDDRNIVFREKLIRE